MLLWVVALLLWLLHFVLHGHLLLHIRILHRGVDGGTVWMDHPGFIKVRRWVVHLGVDRVSVLFQIVYSAKVLEADVALEWLFTGVLSDVAGQVLGSRERHVAVLVALAPEHLLVRVVVVAGGSAADSVSVCRTHSGTLFNPHCRVCD